MHTLITSVIREGGFTLFCELVAIACWVAIAVIIRFDAKLKG